MSRMPLVRFAALLLTSGFLIASAVFGAEQQRVPPVDERIQPRPQGMNVSMDILVNGQPARLISYEGKTYLPVSRMGAQYEIRVNNRGPRRITAVASVDGLSVINGRPASEEDAGYLVDPRNQILIEGWRRSEDRVAAFTFQPRERSYAARIGEPDNVGVIGLVAFEEKAPAPRPLQEERKGGGGGGKGGSGKKGGGGDSKGTPPDVGGTGTGYGRDIASRAVEVPFARSDNKRTMTIYYDTVANLRRNGVPVDEYDRQPLPEYRQPDPFPADPKYAQPPPGVRRD